MSYCKNSDPQRQYEHIHQPKYATYQPMNSLSSITLSQLLRTEPQDTNSANLYSSQSTLLQTKLIAQTKTRIVPVDVSVVQPIAPNTPPSDLVKVTATQKAGQYQAEATIPSTQKVGDTDKYWAYKITGDLESVKKYIIGIHGRGEVTKENKDKFIAALDTKAKALGAPSGQARNKAEEWRLLPTEAQPPVPQPIQKQPIEPLKPGTSLSDVIKVTSKLVAGQNVYQADISIATTQGTFRVAGDFASVMQDLETMKNKGEISNTSYQAYTSVLQLKKGTIEKGLSNQ